MRRIERGHGGIRRDDGVSFTELLVVMFLFTVIGIMVYDLLVGTAQTNLYLEANNDLSEYGQRTVNEIKTEVLQSKRLFDDSSQGQDYLDALELDNAPPPINTSDLATIEVNGSFSPSLASDPEYPFDPESVGNAIFFVQALPPYISTDDAVRIDLYRFMYYYLSKNGTAAIGSQPEILELYRWQSVPFADYNQLNQLNELGDSGATLSATLTALRTADPASGRPAVEVAWNPDEDADDAFYEFSGGSLPASPNGSYEIAMEDGSIAIRNLNAPRIGGDMIYSVAYNTDPDFELSDQVPVFAEASHNQDGFPHGFEVMIGGPTGGRRVMIRLVLAADAGHARLVSRENVVLINARDY
jgi:hypothetical protein